MPGRLEYERAIRRSSLPPPSRHLALTIATWADVHTGIIPDRYQPSLGTLEEATGLSRAAVRKHLDGLEGGLWLVRDRPTKEDARRNHARTRYELRLPPGDESSGNAGNELGQEMPQPQGSDEGLGHEVPQARASDAPDLEHEVPQARARRALKSPSSTCSPDESRPGDGRRPTTGSGGERKSGSAARKKQAAPRMSPGEAAGVGAVLSLLPPQLREQLPDPVPTDITTTILMELHRGIPASQLVDRADRRWNGYGMSLDADTDGGGRGLERPVGVALELLRPGDCTSPRCDGDGTDLDTGELCRTCERTAEDRAADRAVQRVENTPAERPALRQVPDLPRGRDATPAAPETPVQPPLLGVVYGPEPAPPAVPTCTGCGKRVIPRRNRPDHCKTCADEQRTGT